MNKELASLPEPILRDILARLTTVQKRGYTYAEAATYTGLAEGTIRNWACSGCIPVSRLGKRSGKPVILKEDLDELLEADRQGDRQVFEELLLKKKRRSVDGDQEDED